MTFKLTLKMTSTAELHAFPFEDIEKGEICYEDDVAYLTYTSVASKEELNTKEAELAVKVAEQKAAEEAAAAAAAQKVEVLQVIVIPATILLMKVAVHQKAVRLQVNQAVMRGQVLPIHQEMTHVWMMDCYTRTVRMQKVFLNN